MAGYAPVPGRILGTQGPMNSSHVKAAVGGTKAGDGGTNAGDGGRLKGFGSVSHR